MRVGDCRRAEGSGDLEELFVSVSCPFVADLEPVQADATSEVSCQSGIVILCSMHPIVVTSTRGVCNVLQYIPYYNSLPNHCRRHVPYSIPGHAEFLRRPAVVLRGQRHTAPL